MLHIKCFVKHQVSGCPAYALRGFGVASRCQVSGVRKEKLNSGHLTPDSLSSDRTFPLTIRGGMLTSALLDFTTHSARLDSLGEMNGL